MKFEAHPELGEFAEYVTWSRSRKNKAKVEELDARLSQTTVMALDLPNESVFSDMHIEWEVNTHREIFDPTLFVNENGSPLTTGKGSWMPNFQ